jgi:dihydrofolate synthase/folylpolyglutamate synthase
MRFRHLDDWLGWMDGLHPQKMDLGLERVAEVARRMQVTRPAPFVVTVAGTNGKGSTVRTLELLLCRHGVAVGATYSPHLHRFNERILVNGEPVSDQAIAEAFAEIDAARGDLTLTYFEFGALAALTIFRRARVRIAVLEVGLGGRLDAVNLCDTDLAVITSVDLDHQAYLGEDRESIGREKAGILRPGIPLVIGEKTPPESVLEAARALDCRVHMRGRDFDFAGRQTDPSWQWRMAAGSAETRLDDLPRCAIANDDAAAALAAFKLLDVGWRPESIRAAIGEARLPGRFELVSAEVPVILDVAHNPHGGRHLASRLREHGQARTVAVLGMLADKDPRAMARALDEVVDLWFLAPVDDPRGMSVQELEQRLTSERDCMTAPSISEALSGALAAAGPGDRVLVCGSFAAVAEARATLGCRG